MIVYVNSGGSRNFRTGGLGQAWCNILGLKIALVPIYTYPMFL